MKKCTRCNSISSDSDTSCGVCGANLSEVSSESLEQLVHAQPKASAKRKLNRSALVLIMVALAMTAAGASLLVLINTVATFFLLGTFLTVTGLLLTLGIVGGAGDGLGKGRMSNPQKWMQDEEKDRNRRKGQEE